MNRQIMPASVLDSPPARITRESNPPSAAADPAASQSAGQLFDDAYYAGWREARLRYLDEVLGRDYFRGRSVVELGAAFGDLGRDLAGRGAKVHCIEGRGNHVAELLRRHAGILTAQVLDLDGDFAPNVAGATFDIILNFGLLYHLANPQAHLAACAALLHDNGLLILESQVVDAADESLLHWREETGFDQSLSGRALYLPPAGIESLLHKAGFVCRDISSARINSWYNWKVGDSRSIVMPDGHGFRRMWLATRSPAVLEAILGAPEATTTPPAQNSSPVITAAAAVAAAPRSAAKPVVAVFSETASLADLPTLKVSYQTAQFVHLEKYAELCWRNAPGFAGADSLSAIQTGLDRKLDAVIVFDEYSLLNDLQLARMRWDTNPLLVYVSHDFWCHPLRVAERLRRQPRVLMILRHECARQLFDRLLPGVPKVVQRPGVETSIFHPHGGAKEFDVLLGGSETPDYPLRQRLNRLVRENASKLGWKVLDLTAAGLMSNPAGVQREYAPALAASKVSPTASNRGGGHGAKIVTQYFDLSPARAAFQHEFYGLGTPELQVENLDTAGITPRYLESMATKSLLIADIPPQDDQAWYRDKMAVLKPSMTDTEIIAVIDYWVRHDHERETLCERAWRAVQSGETSDQKAAELAQIINEHLS